MDGAEQEVWRRFAEARLPALLHFAYVLTGDSESAKDLVQTALARTLGRWDRVRNSDDPEGYVRRVMINACANQRRRRPWRERLVPEVPDVAAVGSPEHELGWRDAMWHALATLPEGQRAVIVLRYYQDLSEADIARALGCSQGTVKSQTAKAMVKLRAAVTTAETSEGPVPS